VRAHFQRLRFIPRIESIFNIASISAIFREQGCFDRVVTSVVKEPEAKLEDPSTLRNMLAGRHRRELFEIMIEYYGNGYLTSCAAGDVLAAERAA